MKKMILVLMILGSLYAQSKQDIYNNLQREGSVDVVIANPDSTYKLLIWDGDEVKLVTVQNLGSNAFDSLIVNYISGQGNFSSFTSGAGVFSANVSFGVDSTIGVVLPASDSTLWRVKVSPTGVLSADSTGLN